MSSSSADVSEKEQEQQKEQSCGEVSSALELKRATHSSAGSAHTRRNEGTCVDGNGLAIDEQKPTKTLAMDHPPALLLAHR